MQPPLTGSHKNNVSESNKRQYFTEKKNLVDRKMFKSNIHHKTQQLPLKTVSLASIGTTLSAKTTHRVLTTQSDFNQTVNVSAGRYIIYRMQCFVLGVALFTDRCLTRFSLFWKTSQMLSNLFF